jgi:hypothetical protein
MSNIILGGGPSGSGSVTLQAPNTNSNQTVNIPDRAGNLMMDGPAFSVTNNAIQSFSGSTFTKVSYQTKTFDTASCFDNTTNYRYTPNVAGYYMIIAEASHDWGGAAGTAINTMIYKNGSNYQSVSNRGNTGAGPYGGLQVSSLIYMNGTTDYVEVYVWSNNGSPNLNPNNTGGATIFSGYLVRAA